MEGLPDARNAKRTMYFLDAPDAGAIKIGSTTNLAQRIYDIQGDSPVPVFLIGTCDGGLADERRFQQRFDDDRVRGEWYRRTPEIVDFITEAVSAGQLPYLADLDASAVLKFRREVA